MMTKHFDPIRPAATCVVVATFVAALYAPMLAPRDARAEPSAAPRLVQQTEPKQAPDDADPGQDADPGEDGDPEASGDPLKDALSEFARDALADFLKKNGPLMLQLQRELSALVEDLSAYEPPEMLPNGDIIIRRKRPPQPEGPIDL